MRTLYARGGGSRPAPRGLQKILFEDQVSEIIKRETSRADRTGRQFSVVLFRTKSVNGRRWSVGTCRLAHVLLDRVRQTDDVGWFDEHHLCAVLADTPAAGARTFAARTCEEVALRQPAPASVVYAYPGTLPDGANAGAEETEGSASDEYANGHSLTARVGPAWQSGGYPSRSEIDASPRPNGGSHGHDGQLSRYAKGHAGFPRAAGRCDGNALALADAPREHGPAETQRDALIGYFRGGVVSGLEKPGQQPAVVKSEHATFPDAALEAMFVEPMPYWKRALDLVGATLGLVLLSPLLAAAAVAIKLTSAGPVIFKQKRTGLGGRVFTIYKFRTMCVDAEHKQAELRKHNEQDGPAFKLTNDPRVTKVGHLLRKTSIDELPQLLNVILGTMSLVGPRPLPVREQDGCQPWQRHRLNVTPGLTCIWQVDGRSEVTFDEWVRMDVAYMRRRSLWSDLSILFRTVPSVLLRRGAK